MASLVVLVNGPVLRFSQSSSRSTSEESLAIWIIGVRSSSSQPELRIRRCLCGDDTSAWQRQYGDTGEDHHFPQKWLKVALPDDDDQNV